VELKLALQQTANWTNLKGGVPITIDDQMVGAIGVGSGTGDQDVEVALAGIEALQTAIRHAQPTALIS
jgi:uncharacterized protein GlcG (DUF336 family)